MAIQAATASKNMVVAIDGPAGAGKSTVARAVALAVGYVLVDTGAIYRTLALEALRAGLSLDAEGPLAALAKELDLDFVDLADGSTQVLSAGKDVTEDIRSEEISRAAGQVAAHAKVRAALMAMQRAFAARGNAVLEGRDIGTVICPDAPVKIFLAASVSERARRRHEELAAKGAVDTLEQVQADLQARDARDSQRAVAPLRAADDAIHLDCTQMTPDQVVAAIVARVRKVAARLGRPHDTSSAARLVWTSARQTAAPAPLIDEDTVVAQSRQVAEFFALGLSARFAAQPKLVDTLSGTYLFAIEAPGSQAAYLLDCRQAPVKVRQVPASTVADCTLGVAQDTLAAMIAGKLHPQLAFMKGQLKVQGDLAMSMRLGALFA